MVMRVHDLRQSGLPLLLDGSFGKTGACRYCAKTGLDYSAPGLVDLLRSNIFDACKIGISTVASNTDRVSRHEERGWELVRLWNVPTGDDALLVEQVVRRWWRDDLDALRQ